MKFSKVFSRVRRAAGGYSGVSSALIAVFIALVVILNVIIYAFASKFSWYAYTAAEYTHTIGDSSVAYFDDLDTEGREVKIRFCMAEEELDSDQVYDLVHETAKQFAARHEFISVDYINILIDPDEIARYKYGVTPEIDPETGKKVKQNDITKSSVIIDAGGENFVIQQFSNFFVLTEDNYIESYNGEEVMMAMLRWSLVDEHPSVCFTSNHGETSTVPFYNLLMCAGYIPTTLNLILDDIPDDCKMLVISNPLYDFEMAAEGSGIITEIEKIEAFIASGGFVYIAIDPQIGRLPHLDSLLSRYGMTRELSIIRDVSQSLSPDGLSLITSAGDSAVGQSIGERVEAMDTGRVILRSASPIQLGAAEGGATVSPILASGGTAYYNGEVVSSLGDYTVAAMAETASGGSLFFVSSIYLAAQNTVRTNGYANADLLYAVIEEANGTPVPLGCTLLTFDSEILEGLSMGVVHVLTALFIGVVPLAVMAVGTLVCIRRRNR